MPEKVKMEARILYLHKSLSANAAQTEKEWHITYGQSDGVPLSIPLSDYHAQRVPPDLFDADPTVHSTLAKMLSYGGSFPAW